MLATSEPDPSAHCVRVALTGEIDAATAPDAFARVVYAMPRPGDTVALDLREVVFMDSKGVSMLLKVQDYLAVMGCRLLVTNPSAQVVRVLTLLGLDGHFLNNGTGAVTS
jgi:anti-anti-sigma factor